MRHERLHDAVRFNTVAGARDTFCRHEARFTARDQDNDGAIGAFRKAVLCMSKSVLYSGERIKSADLRRLLKLAQTDLSDLFQRQMKSRIYKDRCVRICLCQGAALHYVHGGQGIHDFDVWAFFRRHPAMSFPYRRRGTMDFGRSRFGRNPADSPEFEGRRVDVIGRSIAIGRRESAVLAVQRYLSERKTESARQLAKRPVIALWPEAFFGRVIWPGTENVVKRKSSTP
jgi:hypothetical protein